MFNFVEELADEIIQSPCVYGNIVLGHACYCHNDHEDAPRKCPIWKWDDEWSTENCEFFKPVQ